MGAFGRAHRAALVAKQSRLLVAHHQAHRHGRCFPIRSRNRQRAKIVQIGHWVRQRRTGDAQMGQPLCPVFLRPKIVQAHRLHQPVIHHMPLGVPQGGQEPIGRKTNPQIAAFGRRPHGRLVLEPPRQMHGRAIRAGEIAQPFPPLGRMFPLSQFGQHGHGAQILPCDGIRQRPPCTGRPDKIGVALARNATGDDLVGGDGRLAQRFGNRLGHALRHHIGVLFHPARLRIKARQGAIAIAANTAATI